MPASSLLRSAPHALDLPTYEGSGQCVHPDVIQIGGTCVPHRLLMAMEPYPHAQSAFENPSILGSDDGINWCVPAGVVNPVVPAPTRQGSWHSDGDLLLTREGRLFLYYRYNSGRGETTLLLQKTCDAVKWSAPDRLCTFPVSGRFASPAVVADDETYSLYYVDTIDEQVKRVTSRDGIDWRTESTVFAFDAAWHLDATRAGEWVYLLLNDKRSLFLLRSCDHRNWWILDEDGWRTYRAESTGVRPWPLLSPTSGAWDDALIYRSSLLVESGGLRLWYGAKSTANVWRVGYTDGSIPQ